jgi:hypothetical protein
MNRVRRILYRSCLAVLLGIYFATAKTTAAPADQYVMFVTSLNYAVNNANPYPPSFPSFGSIEAADYYVNSNANIAGLIDWDGRSIIFKAVMSSQAMPALIRFNHLEPGKAILNTLGQPIVASFPDLFQGDSTTLLGPILQEPGTMPPPDIAVWTGTLPSGIHSNSCSNWSNPGISGRVGLANATDSRWCDNGLQGCNFGGRIYGLGVLESPRAPGDYNDDGSVNAADYVVWRDTIGQTGLLLPADGNGNGTVDAPDYDEWRRNFGTVSQIAADSIAAPEPSSWILFVGLLFAISCRLAVNGQRRPRNVR